MAELTTEALNRMIGISATDVAAGKAGAERIAKEQSEKQAQSEAVDKLAMQAEQAIQNIPSSYPGRSSLISDIQGAIASARSSARSGGSVDIAALRQLIAKAEETGKENTNRQASQNYLDGAIVLGQAAQERIEISSQRITEKNLHVFVESMVDPENEMDERTRKRIADSVAAGLQSPEGQRIIEIRNSYDNETRKTTSTLQEVGRAQAIQMRNETRDANRRRALDRAIHSDAVRSPDELENIQKLKEGEITTQEFHQTVVDAEAEKARLAQPFKQAIINGMPADRRAMLAQIGTPDASGIDLQAVMHANGEISTEQRTADWRLLGQYEKDGKHFGDLPVDVQRRLATMEAAKQVIIYGGMEQYNELVLFVAQSKGHEAELSQDDRDLIAKYNIINDPNAAKEARTAAIIDVYSTKNPELYATIQKSPKLKEYTIEAALKSIDANQGKFGIKNNPHLQEITQAVSKDVSERFAAAATSMWEGAKAIISGDVAAAKQHAAAVGEATDSKDIGAFLSDTGVALAGFFSSGPQFNAEIQQQLAGLDLSSLKDAQGNALAIKDAEGKVDMGKVAEALKERGISLNDVDVDTNGDITGQELLTALSKQKQTDQPQVS